MTRWMSGGALSKASSLFLSTKLIFSSVGAALLTTLLVSFSRSQATDLVGQIKTQARAAGVNPADPQGAATLHALLALLAQVSVQAGTGAIRSIFWLIFYGSFGLIALAMILPGRRAQAVAMMEGAPAPAVRVS